MAVQTSAPIDMPYVGGSATYGTAVVTTLDPALSPIVGSEVYTSISKPSQNPALNYAQENSQYYNNQKSSSLVNEPPIKDKMLLQVGGISPKVYVMSGWYTAGSTFEIWTSINYPNSLFPPSGHVLSDIRILEIYDLYP